MIIGNRYEVIRTFEGGMGVAHVCKDLTVAGQLVVLKTYKEGVSNQKFRAALIREANTWIALHGQQYLARIDDMLSFDGRLYLEMPFYANGSLADILQDGHLPLEDAVRLAAQLLMGLRYPSDKAKFLHLDLKPQNVLIGEAKEALITDLGLAKCIYQVNGFPSIGQKQQPDQSGLSGTVPYMAPELFKGDKATVSADIWAWGIIFFEMLTGRHAFTGSTVEEIIISICTKPPNDWHRFRETVPNCVFDLVAMSLEKDPSRRFRSFVQLSEAFDKIIKTGVADEKLPFWKRDNRILLSDKNTAFHWISEVRHGLGVLKAKFTFSELTDLTRAKRYRSIGNLSSALDSLKNILGDDREWALRWTELMHIRLPGPLHLVIKDLGFDAYFGRQALVEVAELRLAVFLDGLYAHAPIPEEEIKAYCQAALQLMESGSQSPKLMELCGQIFLQVQDFDLAEKFFEEAWAAGTWKDQISTGACFATLYGAKGDLQRLLDFTTKVLEPRFVDLDDAQAQETCARPYLFLKNAERSLHFFQRSLDLDINNPWGIMQACIAAWNSGKQAEAKKWRHILTTIAPDSPFQGQIDRLIPNLLS